MNALKKIVSHRRRESEELANLYKRSCLFVLLFVKRRTGDFKNSLLKHHNWTKRTGKQFIFL